MGVLFSAPGNEFAAIRDDWLQALDELAARGVFVGGPAVSEFERSFAEFLGTKGAAGVGNGTDALELALAALGIGSGDEVVAPANTFIATVEAIYQTGATPVLVDCDPSTFLLDLNQAMGRVSSRTKAILPVHLFGQMVDLRVLIPWADKLDIAVVEDCAQAAGARLDGRAAGAWGNAGTFSFYPDKNLGALGDGGAVVSSSDSLLAAIRKLRNHGGETRYEHECPGRNSRLDPIQALALTLKLKRLEEWNARRRTAAGWYEAHLSGTEGVTLPSHRGDESHVFHLYVIRVEADRRDALRKHLQKQGILTAVQYPAPVHLTPAFASLGYGPGDFPAAERLSLEMVSLPMHAALTENDVRMVANAVKSILT